MRRLLVRGLAVLSAEEGVLGMLLNSLPFFGTLPGQITLFAFGALLFAMSFHPWFYGVTGDGRYVATRIRGARLLRVAEKTFNLFMAQENKQYIDWAKYAFYSRLDSGRQVQFLEQNPGFRPYDTLQEISVSGKTLTPSRWWECFWNLWGRVRW